MAFLPEITTAEQLLNTPGLGRCELIRGKLIELSYSNVLRGMIAADIASILYQFVKQKKLGSVLAGDCGFHIRQNPDTVRAPDAAFVSAARIPDPFPEGFFPGPPDLAVEVLSPHDRASGVLAKVADWLESGCRSVWVADPETRTLAVYAPQAEMRIFHRSDMLADENVLPGFKIEIRQLFPS
jgi:Uma2 family endonuclease